MMDRVESFLETRIEGFFNRRFSTHLEPAELVRGLKKEVRKNAGGGNLPNAYIFSLSAEDYQRLCSHRIIDELGIALKKHLIRADLVMDGRLDISFVFDEAIRAGSYRLTSHIQDHRIRMNAAPSECASLVRTIVLERPSGFDVRHLSPPPAHELAVLRVMSGADMGFSMAIGEKTVYMGRMPRNEFLLTDTNISRLHAWIVYEQHRHTLYDAQSRNGTFVAGARISSCRLRDGDELRLGTTTLQYEAL